MINSFFLDNGLDNNPKNTPNKSNRGRVKIDTSKFIDNPRKRSTTESKRKKTLFKQASQLKSLCDTDSCIIINSITERKYIEGIGNLKGFGNYKLYDAINDASSFKDDLTISDAVTLYLDKQKKMKNKQKKRKKKKKQRKELNVNLLKVMEISKDLKIIK